MKLRKLIRISLVALVLATLPSAIQRSFMNLRALGFYHCDTQDWIWKLFSKSESSSVNTRVSLLNFRLCPQTGDELENLRNLLRISIDEYSDPLVHYQIGRLYRSQNLEEDAYREMILSRGASLSVFWSYLLSYLGLSEHALLGYSKFQHLSLSEACEELRAVISVMPDRTFPPDLADTCDRLGQ